MLKNPMKHGWMRMTQSVMPYGKLVVFFIVGGANMIVGCKRDGVAIRLHN